MATIKRRGNIIITRCQKVSCFCHCCEPFQIGEQNVFEITEEEYKAYINGGNWNVSTIWDQSEFVPSQPQTCSSTSNVSKSKSEFASGCFHSVSDIADGEAIYTGPCFGNITAAYSFSYGIQLSLKNICPKFYAKYVAFSNVSTSTISSSPFGYPPNVEFNVDGNNLIAFGNWNPGWRGYSGYQNTSTATLTATFTPQ